MRYSTVALAAAATAVSAQSSTVTPAPEATSNPAGVAFEAEFSGYGGSLQGSIIGASSEDGKGVKFEISVDGLPEDLGPFMYHIHKFPVLNGNCTSAGSHLDPYNRGEVPPCDKSKKETCEVGDLSGKYRNLTGRADSDSYTDLYASTDAKNVAFFGDKSIVLHANDKKRIACANFRLKEGGGDYSSGGTPAPTGGNPGHGNSTVLPTGTGGGNPGPSQTPSFTPGEPTQPTDSPLPTDGSGAGKVTVAGLGLFAGALAFLL